MQKYHPGFNPSDKEAEVRFKEINKAHELLSDPEKWQKYDHFGRYWKQAAEGGVPPGAVPTSVFGSGRRVYTNHTSTPEGFRGFSEFEDFGYAFGGEFADIPAQDTEAAIALTSRKPFTAIRSGCNSMVKLSMFALYRELSQIGASEPNSTKRSN